LYQKYSEDVFQTVVLLEVIFLLVILSDISCIAVNVIVNFFVNSLKDFLPKEYCKVKGIEKKIFQVCWNDQLYVL